MKSWRDSAAVNIRVQNTHATLTTTAAGEDSAVLVLSYVRSEFKAQLKVLLKQIKRTLEGMEGGDASGCVAPGVSEDSVDIYDGLDAGICSNAGKLSPIDSKFRESLDLYEDMVAEEQLSRESSYAELKSKLQAAQSQIQGLRWRLEQMETKNTGLSKENHSLKKNISALLRTARQEVTRKDAEIQKLTQWAERGRHNHSSNIKRHQDLNFSSRTSTASSISSTAPLPTSGPPPHPTPQSKENQSSGDLVHPPRNESPLSRSSEASSHDRFRRDTEEADKRAKQRFRDKDEKHQKPSESTDGKHPNKDSHEPKDKRSYREDTGRKSESQSRKNTKHLNVQGNCQLDVAKTSSKDTSHILSFSSEHKKGGSQDRRPDKVRTASVDHNVKVSCSRESSEYRNIKHSYKREKHSKSKGQKNSSLSQDSERSKDREGSRQKDHQRKAYKDHETSRRHHKSSSHPKTSRGHDNPRHKDGSQDKVDVQSEKRPEKPHKGSSEKPIINENCPNRKLCFMETLNLTLSPNKKPTNGNPDELPPTDTGVENEPDEEDSQINIKDMCVIDEVDNSELDSGDVPEMSKDNLKATSRESRFEDLKDVQGEDRAANSSVQIQPLDRAEEQVTVHLTPESMESNSLKTVEKSESYENRTVVVSNSQATDKSHPSSTSENICEHISPRNATDLCGVKEQPHRRSQDTSTETTVTSHSKNTDIHKDIAKKDNVKCLKTPHVFSPQMCQQDRCSPSSTSVTCEPDRCGERDNTRGTDSVSSTTSLDSVPQEGLSLTEAIYVLTQTDLGTCAGSPAPPQPSPGCIGVSKVSSTTEEQTLPEKCSLLTITPKKSQTQIQGTNLDMSSPVPLLHDEDSMMRTLSSLRRIPDAISPLRSPVQISKRSLVCVQSKPGHVKSLQKDFSTSAADPSSKVDVNKENKYPGSPTNCETQNLENVVSDVPLSLSDTDLEEGEILSESDEATGLQAPATKRPKLAEPVRVKASPSSVLRRRTEERRVAPKPTHEATGGSTQSPKSRFKTVCPAASSASFSTIEEIMETFKLVRTEIRKKYMKLHKTFPKKSFYGVMDNFQKSFFEFVDGADFGQICCQPEELKSKLKKLIASVFSKLLNNGIVKRIFEQQAVDLKQRLWDFVDVQVDYLFKDINGTLKSLKPAKALADDRKSIEEGKKPQQAPVEKPQSKAKEPPHPSGLSRTNSYRTGLGSRGKDIRMTCTEKDSNPPNHQHTQAVVKVLPCKNFPQTPEKKISSLLVSQNSSVLDKTDFELLTEQQASSLTYNLVRDSQMGEIFKCLLQGSDLLESGGIGDGITWSFGTPRKDEERFLSITTPSKFISPSKLLSPAKFDTPHKLLATWNSISPRRVLSPQSKNPTPLNPAVFDESCLLEIPSENQVLLQASHKSYSILAEDLAVSLTLPSPLKSDSHLSFLQSSSAQMVSTPDSIISAHISEDALLGEEDATEQDIHLILDTDNSSSGSSSSVASETLATPFVFSSDVPMKALVTEKSNDHFIVKIRHANTCLGISLTADESLTEDQQLKDHVGSTDKYQKDLGPQSALPSENHLPNVTGISELGWAETGSDHHVTSEESIILQHNPLQKDRETSTEQMPPKDCPFNEPENNLPNPAPSDPSLNKTSSSGHYSAMSYPTERQTNPLEATQEPSSEESQELICSSENIVSRNCSEVPNQQRDPEREGVSEERLTDDSSSSPGKGQKNCDKMKKRKKPSEKVKAKRSRMEDEESQREMSPSRRDGEELKPSESALSPSSLSAKNVVRKKGEVVMAWTRDEDRAILVDLKKNGASRETFSVLSEKLNKPSGQIAHRFYQLMKLFKKQKTDTSSLHEHLSEGV